MQFKKFFSDLGAKIEEYRRKSLRWILLYYACLGAFSVLIGILFPSWLDSSLFMACMLFYAMVFHGSIALIKGWDYVPANEYMDSPFTYYWFIAIAISCYLGLRSSDFIMMNINHL